MSEVNKELQNISVNVQYIKDLSFENPNAPESLGKLSEAPNIDLSLDIAVNAVKDNDYEVALEINAKASTSDKTLFEVELNYAGIFTLSGFAEEQKKVLLAVHCPAMLFPYARKIISDATQEGGYQPLLIDPIDFGELFHKRMMEEQQAQQNSSQAEN